MRACVHAEMTDRLTCSENLLTMLVRNHFRWQLTRDWVSFQQQGSDNRLFLRANAKMVPLLRKKSKSYKMLFNSISMFEKIECIFSSSVAQQMFCCHLDLFEAFLNFDICFTLARHHTRNCCPSLRFAYKVCFTKENEREDTRGARQEC